MNPYASPFRRAVVAAYLRRAFPGPDYQPARAVRIYNRWERVIRLAALLNEDGTPANGSCWQRKLSGRIWRVWGRRDELIEIRLMGRPKGTTEQELVPLDYFLAHFQPEGLCGTCGGLGGVDSGGVTPWGDGIMVPCPACEGDVTFPHNSDCNHAPGN